MDYGVAGHYVLVEEVSDVRVVASDPALGRLAYAPSSFRAVWTGDALLPRLEGPGGPTASRVLHRGGDGEPPSPRVSPRF